MKRILFVISLFTVFQATTLFAGGPWAEGKGKGYAELSGGVAALTTTQDFTFQFYGELGLTNKLTMKAILPYKMIAIPHDITILPDAGMLYGLSNITIGAKYQLTSGKLPLSLGLDVGLNTFNSNDSRGLRTGYEAFSFSPVFALGQGLSNGSYWYAELKPGIYTNNHSEILEVIAEYGAEPKKNFWIALYASGRISFKNGDFNNLDHPNYRLTEFYTDKQQYLTVGPKFSYEFKNKLGINAATFYTLDLNVAEGGNSILLKAGLFYNW